MVGFWSFQTAEMHELCVLYTVLCTVLYCTVLSVYCTVPCVLYTLFKVFMHPSDNVTRLLWILPT